MKKSDTLQFKFKRLENRIKIFLREINKPICSVFRLQVRYFYIPIIIGLSFATILRVFGFI